jgi:penicillin amidase
VASANNRTIGDDYPHYIGTWFDVPYRIDRIREMLDETALLGSDDFRRMLRDEQSHLARELTPLIIHSMQGNAEGIYGEALSTMEDWDYEMSTDAAAPMLLDLTWIALHKVLFQDELGDEVDILLGGGGIPRRMIYGIVRTGQSAWCDDVSTPDHTEDFGDNLRSAFHAAVDSVAARFGDNPSEWRWGDLHQTSLDHPMGGVAIVEKLFGVNSSLYPVGGSFHTVRPFAYPLGESFLAHHGASQRHIYDPSDWDKSLSVIPTGNSGVPASPHYLDQTDMYINNQYHRDHFSREAVEANYKYKAVFAPQLK